MTDEVLTPPEPPAPPDALERFALTEDRVKEVLKKARGDILVAAKYLKLSLREFDRILQTVPEIMAFMQTIAEVKANNPEYRRWSEEEFERQADRAYATARLAAIESLYDLATMPMSENAAMMNVKREAAVNLLGRDERGGRNLGEQSEFFKALAAEFAQVRPKMVVVRETISIEAAEAQPLRKVETLEGEAQRLEHP